MRKLERIFQVSLFALLPLVMLLFSVPSSADGAGGRLIWENQFDRAGGDESINGIAVEGERVFVAGFSTNASGNADFLVRAHDTRTGKLLWMDNFDNAGGDDLAFAVKADGARAYAAGFVSTAAGTLALAIRAYDSKTGRLLWQNQIDPGSGFFNFFEDLAVHGNLVFAAGVVHRGTGNRDWLVRAYDAKTGALRWEDQFDRAGLLDRARHVVVDDGRVFVTGTAQSAAPDDFGLFYVRAYHEETGALLWEDHAAGIFGDGVDIAAEGGRVFASGTVVSPTETTQDWLVRAYDAKGGTILWQDRFNRGGNGVNIAFAVAASGGRVFAGGNDGRDCLSFSAPSNCNFLVRGYDGRTGKVLWEDQRDENGADDRVLKIAAHGDRVFAVGLGGKDCTFFGTFDPDSTHCDFLLRAYGARSGKLLWEDRVDKTGGNDEGVTVVVQENRVFAAGDTALPGNPSHDALVRVYDAGGGDGDDEKNDGDHGKHGGDHGKHGGD